MCICSFCRAFGQLVGWGIHFHCSMITYVSCPTIYNRLLTEGTNDTKKIERNVVKVLRNWDRHLVFLCLIYCAIMFYLFLYFILFFVSFADKVNRPTIFILRFQEKLFFGTWTIVAFSKLVLDFKIAWLTSLL